MKIYQITFSFLDPSKAVAEILANNPEEAKTKLLEEIENYAPQLTEVEILTVEEVINDPTVDEEDISEDRILN